MNHPQKERTLVLLKPDSIQRSLIGEIMARLERTGLKLVGAKMVRASEAKLLEHYGKDDEWYAAKGSKRKKFLIDAGVAVDAGRADIEFGKDIIKNIVHFMRSSPVLALIWEGNQAVAVVKKLVGSTDPTTSDVGTIRGDLQIDSYYFSDTAQRGLRNLVHCTDQAGEAEREIKIWFTPEEIHEYRHINEAILEDVNADGTKE
ncbi:MAG TPA: nucleoside-diphosphate kinase [Candidatus Paceibacterota bacterium]|nr:nucleoside-diphosphate kinase [Candidatus Paceibacterota bacterium]